MYIECRFNSSTNDRIETNHSMRIRKICTTASNLVVSNPKTLEWKPSVVAVWVWAVLFCINSNCYSTQNPCIRGWAKSQPTDDWRDEGHSWSERHSGRNSRGTEVAKSHQSWDSPDDNRHPDCLPNVQRHADPRFAWITGEPRPVERSRTQTRRLPQLEISLRPPL